MAHVTAEVVPASGGTMPYKIIFHQDGMDIGELAVPSVAAGEAIIEDILGKLEQLARDEGDA